jgi:diguanylate cyclase (GGDEF)-like protein
LNAGLSRLRVRRDEVLHCRDARADPRVDREAAGRAGVLSIVSVPLRHRGNVLGALKLYSRRAGAFKEDDVSTLELLAGLLAAHLAELRAAERHRAESTRDGLTGLPNRRAFEERLGTDVARIRRHGGTIALCLLDVDGFQAVNDTLGRKVGDEVLRGIARNLAQVRGEDEAFRLDADEFALIFCEVDTTGARIAASRLAAAIQSDRGCGGVTVTWGVAELDGGDPAALVAQAEDALDQAKRAGSI